MLTCLPHADDRYWKKVSDDAKDFVKGLLTVDPAHRLSAEEAMKHPWLNGKGIAPEHDLSAGLRENYRRRWKTAINAVRAGTRFKSIAEMASSSGAPATKKKHDLISDDEDDEDEFHESSQDISDKLKQTSLS